MEYMRLEHTGFVARPLYVCTNTIEGGEMCMNVASMSKFIQQRDERNHYRCKKCREKKCHDSAPLSDSVPLRILDLYILVHDGIKSTFMRSKAFKLCLRRPPAQWGWGVELAPIRELKQAQPSIVYHGHRKFYEYNDAESEAIWCMSSSYQGKPQ